MQTLARAGTLLAIAPLTVMGAITPTEYQQNTDFDDSIGYIIESTRSAFITDKSDTIPRNWTESNYTRTPVSEVVGKLTSFMELKDGWDGYDGRAPSIDAIQDAISFAEKLNINMKMPKPMLSSDGEVGLFWEKDQNYIDVGFYGEKIYSFYAQFDDGQEILRDDVALEDELQEELKNKFIQLA